MRDNKGCFSREEGTHAVRKIIATKPSLISQSAAGRSLGELMTQIERHNFPRFIGKLAAEFKGAKGQVNHQVVEMTQEALKSMLLIDLYTETGDSAYIEEGEKILDALYKQQLHPERKKLKAVVEEALKFIPKEAAIKAKIDRQESFSLSEIDAYLVSKSGDSLIYGALIQRVVPQWRLSEALRIQISLYDMAKDIADYSEDVTYNQTNLMRLYFSGRIAVERMPPDNERALALFHTHGYAEEIKAYATMLKRKALSMSQIEAVPSLYVTIEENYQRLKTILD